MQGVKDGVFMDGTGVGYPSFPQLPNSRVVPRFPGTKENNDDPPPVLPELIGIRRSLCLVTEGACRRDVDEDIF